MSTSLWSRLRLFLYVASQWELNCNHMLGQLRTKIRSFVVRRSEYPLQTVGNQPAMETGLNQAIPPLVVQTWVADAFGRSHAREIRRFRALNPNLRYSLFNDADTDAYVASVWAGHPISEIYNRARYRPLQTDIFRYCILFERGGYYFDISKGCSVPLASLHAPEDCRLLSYEHSFCSVMPDLATAGSFQYPDRYLIQWGFGFAPADPILKRVIDNICAYYPLFKGRQFENPKSAILAFTGPGMFTKAVREIVQEEGKLEGAQAGVNFNGHGIPWMPGSEVRYHLSPPYVLARNAVIVS